MYSTCNLYSTEDFVKLEWTKRAALRCPGTWAWYDKLTWHGDMVYIIGDGDGSWMAAWYRSSTVVP
jgi:hypothetical protein